MPESQKTSADLLYEKISKLESKVRQNEDTLLLLEGQFQEVTEAFSRLEKLYSRDKQRKMKTEVAQVRSIIRELSVVCDSPIRSKGLAIGAYGERILIVDLADPGMASYLRKLCQSPRSLKELFQRTRSTIKILKKYMEHMGWEKKPKYAVALRRI